MYERKFLVEHVASDGITHNWRSATISSSTSSSSSKWYDASSENFKYGFYFVSMAFVCFQCFSLFCWARAVAATRKMRKHKAHFIFMLFAFLRWMDDKIAHTKTENKQTDFCAKFLWFVFVIFCFVLLCSLLVCLFRRVCASIWVSVAWVMLLLCSFCYHANIDGCQNVNADREHWESRLGRGRTRRTLSTHTQFAVFGPISIICGEVVRCQLASRWFRWLLAPYNIMFTASHIYRWSFINYSTA